MWGGWGEQGKTYEHDVLDIAEGHSSWLIRIVFGMDMILFQLVYNKRWEYYSIRLSSIKRYVRLESD